MAVTYAKKPLTNDQQQLKQTAAGPPLNALERRVSSGDIHLAECLLQLLLSIGRRCLGVSQCQQLLQ